MDSEKDEEWRVEGHKVCMNLELASLDLERLCLLCITFPFKKVGFQQSNFLNGLYGGTIKFYEAWTNS